MKARPFDLKLGRDSYVVMQELRRDVRAIRPDKRMELRMNRESLEVHGIT